MKNVLWTVALGALLCASPAFAQQADEDAEVTKMAKEHYKAGLDAYKSGKYDVAIKELKKAYLLKRLPALLLNIGATYRKMGDLDLALHFYQKYLEEAPADARDRGDVEKTIAEIKTEKAGGGAKEEVAEKPASKEETPAPPPPPPAKEWSHVPVDAAPPDSPLDVRVSSPVMKGVKVYVFYRGAGEEGFKQVLMHRRGAEKIGRIPADAMQGKAIQYYVEARDPAGTVVKSSGSAVSPNVVMIDPSAPPQMVASIGGEESKSRAAEEAQQQQGDESATSRRNSEDEEAPMSGQVGEPRKTKRRAAGGGGGKLGVLTTAGIAVGAVGVGVLAGGIACGVLAMQKANQISGDSMNPIDQNNNKIFFNNDPNAGSTQEADLASQGKLLNDLGIALDVVGGVAAVGGVAMIIVDQLVLKGGKEKPKKRRAAPRPVEEEVSSIKNWYVAPTTSHNFAGVTGGFQF